MTRGTVGRAPLQLFCLPQLHGKLRVILEPLMGNMPLVGAVTMFFIRRPVSAAAGNICIAVGCAPLLCTDHFPAF